jgi:hypothetical protein
MNTLEARVLQEILKLVETTPNDYDLGKVVRIVYHDYKEGKLNDKVENP